LNKQPLEIQLRVWKLIKCDAEREIKAIQGKIIRKCKLKLRKIKRLDRDNTETSKK